MRSKEWEEDEVDEQLMKRKKYQAVVKRVVGRKEAKKEANYVLLSYLVLSSFHFAFFR